MDARKISFDGWTLDVKSGELAREGVRIRLQEQPQKLLEALLAQHGGVVLREQLIAQLWPKGVVDYEAGLNTLVHKLRVALGDTAERPRYIETLPRRGYCFIAQWHETDQPRPTDSSAAVPIIPPPTPSLGPPVFETAPPRLAARSQRRLPAPGSILVRVAVGLVLFSVSESPPVPTVEAPRASESAALAIASGTVAVLPFDNLSPEPNNDYLALGISEIVLQRLASLKELTVISASSSFMFRNRDGDTREIGRKLNARYLVGGSVQRIGPDLRVTAGLIDSASGASVWSESFDRTINEIFPLQDEIAARVGAALAGRLGDQPLPTHPAVLRTRNLDAYLAYLQGRALVSTFRVADAEAAIERFSRAIALDPAFAAAYAQKSLAITRVAFLRNFRDRATATLARSLNEQALSIDASLGEAWVQRANMRDWTVPDEVVGAEAEFRKGLALAPNYAQGHAQFAEFLYNLGRDDEALVMIERARQIDPLEPRNHYIEGLMLWSRSDGARPAAALFRRALEVSPNFHPAIVRLAQIRERRGEYAGSIKLAERALAIDPQALWVRSYTVLAYLAVGDVAAARDLLAARNFRDEGQDVCLLRYQGDARGAARAARRLLAGRLRGQVLLNEWLSCVGLVLRDEALATRRYDLAARTLEPLYAARADSRSDASLHAAAWALPYAEVLAAGGDRERATRVVRAAVGVFERASTDDESSDLDFAYERALALLGDTEGAIAALTYRVRAGGRWDWWIIEREPAFAAFRGDPRFQAILQRLRSNAARQAALVERMRRSGEIPIRPAPQT